jgi:Sulfotransferase family
VFTGEVIGRDQLELWARGLERFTAERARHDPARFLDVDYSESTADPVRTVEAVYAHFGLALTGPARAAIEALRRHGAPAGVGSAHRYALSDFGLTDRQVGERFAGYR